MNKDHSLLLDAALMRHLLFRHLEINQGVHIYIALSGGVDSITLTHLLGKYREEFQPDLKIIALHFDHGLNSQSQAWRKRCEVFCNELHIEFHYKRQPIQAKKQHSLEALARQARYEFFARTISRLSQHYPAVLCTAHHQNDQAETVLLNLSKGSHSLPLIREKRHLSNNRNILLMRPLLDISRADIEQYARDNQLDFIEDPSNQSRNFDRNFLRHDIIPILQKRWPEWTTNIARLAKIWQGRHDWQQQYLEILINQMQDADAKTLVCRASPLPLKMINQYNRQFSHDLLNYWLVQNSCSLPSYQRINEWLTQIALQKNGYASIDTDVYQLQYYNGRIYLLDNEKLQKLKMLSKQQYFTLKPPQSFITQGYTITFNEGCNAIDKRWIHADWQIRYAQKNSTIRLPGRPNKTLKNLFQENHIPKWMRDIMPLVYIDGALAYVPGVGVDIQFMTNAIGIEIVLK